jgi:hypothetical protein
VTATRTVLRRLPDLRAAVLLRAALIGGVFTMASRPLFDPDLWWHLANGRLILRHGIPTEDVYSWTARGHHWVVQEWLAEVGMYLLHRGGGLVALFLVAGAIAAFTVALVERSLRRTGLGPTGAVALGAVLALLSSWAWGPRPQLFNFLFAAVVVEVLFRYRARPSPRVWWLLALFALWANLHNSYVGGAGLVLVFAVGETVRGRLASHDLRRLWVIGVVGPLAGLLTPFGVHTVTFAVRIVGSAPIQARLLEWQSPRFDRLPGRMLLAVLALMLLAGPVAALVSRRGRSDALLSLVAAELVLLTVIATTSPNFHTLGGRGLLLLVLAGVAVGARVSPGPKADATELLLGLAGVALALHALRFTGMLAVAGAPLAARSACAVRDALGRTRRRSPAPSRAESRLHWAIAGVLGLLAVVRVAVSLAPSNVDAELARKQPVGALATLRATPADDRLFNFYDYGGYLIWHAPDHPVFIDGRAEVYGNELFSEYLDLQDLKGDWRARIDALDVSTVLMPFNSPMGQELVAHGWTVAYQDGRSYVVRRRAA